MQGFTRMRARALIGLTLIWLMGGLCLSLACDGGTRQLVAPGGDVSPRGPAGDGGARAADRGSVGEVMAGGASATRDSVSDSSARSAAGDRGLARDGVGNGSGGGAAEGSTGGGGRAAAPGSDTGGRSSGGSGGLAGNGGGGSSAGSSDDEDDSSAEGEKRYAVGPNDGSTQRTTEGCLGAPICHVTIAF
jgi:hypothetical protein